MWVQFDFHGAEVIAEIEESNSESIIKDISIYAQLGAWEIDITEPCLKHTSLMEAIEDLVIEEYFCCKARTIG